MTYFVNVRIESDANGMYFQVNELHSGQSHEEIMRSIIDVRTEWANNNLAACTALAKLNPLDPREKIESEINQLVEKYMIDDEDEYLEKYNIDISDHYTDVNKAFKFYKKFEKERDKYIDNYEDMEINFYGDLAKRFEKVFSYLYLMSDELSVRLKSGPLRRLIDILS